MGKKLSVFLRKKVDTVSWDFLFAELEPIKVLKNEKLIYIDIRKFFGEGSQEPPQPTICKSFGCGKHLSPTEQLYGERCVNHQRKETTLSIIDKHLSL